MTLIAVLLFGVPVPEPASILLLVAGAGAVLLLSRKKTQ